MKAHLQLVFDILRGEPEWFDLGREMEEYDNIANNQASLETDLFGDMSEEELEAELQEQRDFGDRLEKQAEDLGILPLTEGSLPSFGGWTSGLLWVFEAAEKVDEERKELLPAFR